jgi:hypothetical protein
VRAVVDFPDGPTPVDSRLRRWPTADADLLREMRMKKIYEKPVLVKRQRLSAVTAFMGPSSGGKPPM